MHMPGEDDPAAGFYAALEATDVLGVGAILPSSGTPSSGIPDVTSDSTSVEMAGTRGRLWRIRGMAVLPERRGEGLGSRLLDALIDHAVVRDASLIWASVRIPARTFYERAGFVATSGTYETPSIGPHVQMMLVLGRPQL